MKEITVLELQDSLVQIALLLRDASAALARGNDALFRDQMEIAEEQYHSSRIHVYPSTQRGRALISLPCEDDHGVDYAMGSYEPDPLVVEFYDELVQLGKVFEDRSRHVPTILRVAEAFELITRVHFPHTLDRLEAERISSS